ncbi:MAG: NAD-dependent dehydratase [Cytophagaceae bacterium]|nr:NAD-dependent dehydratase [Cytophagaceae bacterium]
MSANKESVLVAGANGTTGRIIVQLLQESQYFTPVAMLRNEEQVAKFKEQKVRTVLADLEESLDHTLKDIDKVVFAAGSGGHTPPEKTTAVDQEGAKNLIEASRKAGVDKFVMLSAINADDPGSSEKLGHYLEAKKIADEYLVASGLNYAILRPGTLKNDPGTGKVKIAGKLNEGGKISREDVARVIVAALNDDTANNETFEIIEGETLIGKALHGVSA